MGGLSIFLFHFVFRKRVRHMCACLSLRVRARVYVWLGVRVWLVVCVYQKHCCLRYLLSFALRMACWRLIQRGTEKHTYNKSPQNDF
jgi:hypothetical protein